MKKCDLMIKRWPCWNTISKLKFHACVCAILYKTWKLDVGLLTSHNLCTFGCSGMNSKETFFPKKKKSKELMLEHSLPIFSIIIVVNSLTHLG